LKYTQFIQEKQKTEATDQKRQKNLPSKSNRAEVQRKLLLLLLQQYSCTIKQWIKQNTNSLANTLCVDALDVCRDDQEKINH
jgi:hypothetical protein